MQPLEHDPKAKQQIKDALYSYIYGPITRQFRDRIDDLINKNTVLGGYTHRHFVYRGQLYNADSSPPPLKRNRLVAQLRNPMEEYLNDMKELNDREIPYVLGFINQVLNSSNSLSDYLRVLPEALHQPIEQLLATCPCRMGCLSQDQILQLKKQGELPVDLIKRRLVSNLLV